MPRRSPEELSDLARELVAGKLTADQYLREVLPDRALKPLALDRSTGTKGRPIISGERWGSVSSPMDPHVHKHPHLTDAEIDSLARRAKVLL